ncbi:MAG: response regulator transcription factor [Terracidiphilus sp.]
MESRHRPRLLIADDHKLVAEACKGLLEPEFDVIALVPDGRALLEAAAELRPDVVILDIAMPELNGLDAGEQIKHQNRSTKLIYLTMTLDPEVAAEAFRRGASGYVLKQCNAEELVIAVRRVLRGESYLSPLITKDTVEFLLRSGATYQEEKRISSRQSEVLQLLAEGKTMKEIAYILKLKTGTVAFHKYRIMDVLGIKTTAALIEYAIRHHVIASTK